MPERELAQPVEEVLQKYRCRVYVTKPVYAVRFNHHHKDCPPCREVPLQP